MDPLAKWGWALVFGSGLLLVLGSYAVLFSVFLPLSGLPILDTLAMDNHYKYFALLLVPTAAYFVIANWVGWQYYQNS
ncbi:hypothetical protein FRC03_010797 [Tulasnella sp. 419]|nr:hypothetical protein FRC02_001268 [Tulasnella sp. 418]KAG8967049.1 hypothetical protein FRC03_010797 [Tulasnella sp. 419]